jgi:rod shape determining protein RodA
MLSLFVFGVAPDARSDARNWLPIGGIYFQPSELLKIAFIITFTVHIDWVKTKIHELKTIILLALHGAFPVGLVIVTGDFSVRFGFLPQFLSVRSFLQVFDALLDCRFAVIFAAAPLLWIRFFSDFQKQRFLAVYYPQGMSSTAYKTVIYQQQQSINAIGSGQLTGKGLFKGTFIQNGLVPVDESDMIFAVVGEELGLLGAWLH